MPIQEYLLTAEYFTDHLMFLKRHFNITTIRMGDQGLDSVGIRITTRNQVYNKIIEVDDFDFILAQISLLLRSTMRPSTVPTSIFKKVKIEVNAETLTYLLQSLGNRGDIFRISWLRPQWFRAIIYQNRLDLLTILNEYIYNRIITEFGTNLIGEHISSLKREITQRASDAIVDYVVQFNIRVSQEFPRILHLSYDLHLYLELMIQHHRHRLFIKYYNMYNELESPIEWVLLPVAIQFKNVTAARYILETGSRVLITNECRSLRSQVAGNSFVTFCRACNIYDIDFLEAFRKVIPGYGQGSVRVRHIIRQRIEKLLNQRQDMATVARGYGLSPEIAYDHIMSYVLPRGPDYYNQLNN